MGHLFWLEDETWALIRLACVAFVISQSCYRYSPKLSGENIQIADWLILLTRRNKGWGFGLCFLYLRNIKGYRWNHKWVYRIYRELALNMRIRPKKRFIRKKTVAQLIRNPNGRLKKSGALVLSGGADRQKMGADFRVSSDGLDLSASFSLHFQKPSHVLLSHQLLSGQVFMAGFGMSQASGKAELVAFQG